MTALDLVKLRELMQLTSGRSEIAVAMVDGPIASAIPISRAQASGASRETRSLSARKLTVPLAFTGLLLRAF